LPFLVGLAGITVPAWAHRRGHRLAGVTCCAITGLLISPFSWTHHWVRAVPLLVALAAIAWRCRQPGTAWPWRPPPSSPGASRYPGRAFRPARSGYWRAISTYCAAWPC
jgi:alpha-1,2-mannosyltransferase